MHPILFDFGTLEVFGLEIHLAARSYGTLFFLAVLVGWGLCVKLGRRVSADAPWTVIYLGSIVAGVVGARVLNALIFLPAILRGEETLGGILTGGGTWLPGVLTGTLALWWLSRRHGLKLGDVTNVFFVGIPLVHGIGRVGCLLGGCCYGKPTSMPWGIAYTSAIAAEHNGTPLGVAVHPTPVYDLVAELFNFVVVVVLWRRRAPPWAIPAAWAVLYGTQRFVIEFFRGDPRGQYGSFSSSQWFSLVMVPVAAYVLWRIRSRAAVSPG
jgi:phosphatidylglycerol:prolipoprotein diacylglycerol transferase